MLLQFSSKSINICFRLKHGKEIKARLDAEKKELEEQKKKEELGIIR